MSRARLAQLAGLDVSHVARIERGQGNPTMFALIQLATALGLKATDFLDGLDASHLPAHITAMSEQQYRAVMSTHLDR